MAKSGFDVWRQIFTKGRCGHIFQSCIPSVNFADTTPEWQQVHEPNQRSRSELSGKTCFSTATHADVVHQAEAMHALDVTHRREEEDLCDCVAAIALS